MIALLLYSLFAISIAEIQWFVGKSSEDRERRLELGLTASSTDITDPNCIVGGADSAKPEKVYVGGPCSKLNVTMNDDGTIASVKPQAEFRWIEMEVVKAGIKPEGASLGEEAELEEVPGSAFQHSDDTAAYAKVGTAVEVKVKDKEAMLISGQTSYLAKQSGSFSKNSFAFAKTGANKDIELCVAKCCTPTTGACQCTDQSCSGTIPYSAGQYKFSVYLASMDSSIANGNGWEHIEATYGTGTPKKLKGDFFVDQVIDFTNMQSDTLKITKVGGTTIEYSAMTPFNGTNEDAMYEVEGVKISAGDWSADYAFPGTYNKGSWSNNGQTLTTDYTDKVKIFCIRASSADLVKLGFPATSKIIMFRYQFDIDGITANANSGKWITYDPTITSSAGTTGTGGTGATTGNAGGSNCLLPSFALLASAIVSLLLKD